MFDYSSIDLRSLFVNSGTMAAGISSDSEIFQFRWTHATQRAVIPLVRFSAGVGATAFTAGSVLFRLGKAQSWTVDGTGGSAATLTGNQGKLDSTLNAQALPGVRIATTAALGAGTKTIVADHGGVSGGATATAGDTLVAPTDMYSDLLSVSRPIILNQNEGLIIRAIVPATGTWNFGVQIVWGVV
jgi:hypothetical protein